MNRKNSAGSLPPLRKRRRGHTLRVLGWTLATSGAAAFQPAILQAQQPGQPPKSQTSEQSGRVLEFDIPAGPLEGVFGEFQRVAGMSVAVADPGISKVQSPGVHGSLTPQKAMEALLSGTGLHASFSPDSVRVEIQRLRASVAVEEEAERLHTPKATADLLDTPQTAVVIPEQVYLEQNAGSLRDVLRNTTGITMSIGEGGSGGTSSGDNVLIRGFSARNDIYLDGARDPGLVNRDVYNTEAVEVVKGPGSTNAGRGATGGYINMVTKAPKRDDSLSARFMVGNADYKRGMLDWNHRLGDSAAFRLNGVWQDTGYPGRDVAKYRTWGVAPSLAFGLGKPTSVVLSYSHEQQDNVPDWGIPALLPDVAIAKGVTINDINFSNWYGLASRDYELTKSDHGTVTVTHQFSDNLVLRNLTRYGRNYRDSVMTPPRPATTVAGQGPEDPGYDPTKAQIRRTDTKYQHRDDRYLANQMDLTSSFETGRLKHSTDIGFEISRDHQPTFLFTDLFSYGRPPVDDLFTPTPYEPYTPALARTGATTNAWATTAALYAFDSIALSEHWLVDLGGRWDYVDASYNTFSPTGAVANFGRTDSAFSGRAGLLYKPVAKGTIYGAISTSFAPSFDGTLGLTLAATGVNSQALAPEKTRNIEVGTKWDFTRNVRGTLALFKVEKTNAKTTDLNGVTVLAGDQEVKGVELGLTGNLTSRWSIFGGLALMNGKVVGSGVVTEVGQQLAYVPHTSFTLWSTYRVGKRLTLGGGASYNSGHYFNNTGGFYYVTNRYDPRYVANAAAIQALTRYWVVNAAAIYAFNRHFTLQVNGLNLGNTRYADRAYDRHFLPGPTRQFLIGPVISW